MRSAAQGQWWRRRSSSWTSASRPHFKTLNFPQSLQVDFTSQSQLSCVRSLQDLRKVLSSRTTPFISRHPPSKSSATLHQPTSTLHHNQHSSTQPPQIDPLLTFTHKDKETSHPTVSSHSESVADNVLSKGRTQTTPLTELTDNSSHHSHHDTLEDHDCWPAGLPHHRT